MVLVLHTVVLVLQVWFCVVKHGLVTLVVVVMILEGHSNFSSRPTIQFLYSVLGTSLL